MPLSKWLITMVIVSPLSRVVPPSEWPFMAYTVYMGLTNHLLTNWDDPPSGDIPVSPVDGFFTSNGYLPRAGHGNLGYPFFFLDKFLQEDEDSSAWES